MQGTKIGVVFAVLLLAGVTAVAGEEGRALGCTMRGPAAAEVGGALTACASHQARPIRGAPVSLTC